MTKTPMIRPMNDRVLLRRDPDERVTSGGIHIPDSAQERVLYATVLVVGPGKRDENGRRAEPSVKAGDRVMMSSKYVGTEVTLDGEKLTFCREDELMAVQG